MSLIVTLSENVLSPAIVSTPVLCTRLASLGIGEPLILTCPVPFELRFKSIFVSLPSAAIVGPVVVAAFVTLI